MAALQEGSSSAFGLRGRVLVVLAVAPFLIGALNGNLHGLHLGMDNGSRSATSAVSAPSTGPGKPHGAGATADGPGATVDGAGASAVAISPARVPSDTAAQQLMHLLGACLAVLLAGAALGGGMLQRRGHVRDGVLVPHLHARWVSDALRGAWRPPPLSPPTSSPVIRT